MAGQYPNFPGYSPYYNVETGQPIMPQEGYVNPYQPYHSLSSEQLHAAYVDYEDPNRAPIGSQAPNRGRRRSAPGADHVKHRRTRSGCFTCRNRRVKCDETHPICERCRKGNRECVYPEPTSSSKSKSGAKSKASPTDSGDSQDDLDFEGKGDGKEPLPPIPDEDQVQPSDSGTQSQSQAQSASSPSPSTEGSASVPPQPPPSRPVPSRRASRQSLSKSSPAKSLNELPAQLRFYLDYHRNHITCHHYALKHDGTNWVSTTFLQIAVRNPPLLYAVVGFAAYHHTLSKPNGRMQDFLEFYNQSVKLLRQSIERKQRHSVATLLTILQLASIEEVLGDWVNLRGHQKAAFEILTSLYTPQSVNQNETLRKALQWYVRFDLFVGLQSGSEAMIGREWFEENYKHWAQQVLEKPNDLGAKYEERFAYSRWMAEDCALLFSRKGKGQISDEAFGSEIMVLAEKFASWEANIDPDLINPASLVKDFSDWPARDPDDIIDPHDPNYFFIGDLWTTNFIFIDFWAITLMFKSLLALVEGKPPSMDIVQLAFKTAQTFEGVQLCPNAPAGAVLEAQASLALASLFLPRDEKTVMWCRKKFADIESAGYIYPITLRDRMQGAWNVDLSEWWLPEPHAPPPMIRKLRNFAAECSATPRDQTSEDLRVMKGIFSSLSLEDSESPRDKGKGIMTPNSEETREFDWATASVDESINWEQTPPEFKWDYNHDS